ncbi:hypothetical protein HYW21_05515 [Candidatus Woesearchaeota archaeon]|nr:hypothetical protein [Candidatus Woesearchaeota archaeon]
MKPWIYLVTIVLFSIQGIAVDCSWFLDQTDCNAILASNLTDDEKELAVVNLLYTDYYVANHTFIQNWNTGLDITEPPENVMVANSTFIANAWMTLLTIMPSMRIEDNPHIRSSATIMAGYGYEVIVPENYQARAYPETNNGDCQRSYRLQKNSSVFSVSDGQKELGNNRSVTTNFSKNTTLYANYTITTQISVDHYQWKLECCRELNYECVEECWQCRHNTHEDLVDSIVLNDSLVVVYDDDPEITEFTLINQYRDTNIGIFNNRNSNIHIESGNASYASYKQFYSLDYDSKPYYVLQLVADPINETQVRNVYTSQDVLIFARDPDCQITYSTHFLTKNASCLLNFSQITIGIDTNKFQYAINESIYVTLLPANTPMTVSYGNITVEAENATVFRANPLATRITAQHGYLKTATIIAITNPENWELVADVSVFSALHYVLFLVLRKYWGGFFG